MSTASEKAPNTVDVDLVAAQFDVLDRETHRTALLEAIRARDVYRRLVEELKDQVEKLQQGLIGPKSQRFKSTDDPQLSLHILAELLGRSGVEGEDAQKLAQELLATAEKEAEASAESDAADGIGGDIDGDGDVQDDPKPHRPPRKPTGRRTARNEVIHKVTIERLSEEVQRLGLDAFERIGEDRMTTVERRVAALFEVTPAAPPLRARASALDCSTLYGWLDALRELLAPLINAMLRDARTAPYLCTDATGVLVQAPSSASAGTSGCSWCPVAM